MKLLEYKPLNVTECLTTKSKNKEEDHSRSHQILKVDLTDQISMMQLDNA